MPEPPYRPLDAQVMPCFAGVRRFMRLPVAVRLEGVDAAAVGFPFDPATSVHPGFGVDLVESTHAAVSFLRPLRGVGLAGCEVVEVSPPYDRPGRPTALAAASALWELLSLRAVAP